MSRSRSIRKQLLGDQILVILLLAGAILATTFTGARRTVETLSRTIVERSVDEADGKLRRFFDPVSGGLLALRAWAEAGLLDIGDPSSLEPLAAPLVARLPQISGVLLADGEGRGSYLLRTANGWQSRRVGADDPDPRTRPWFVGALARRDAAADDGPAIHWTEPYLFQTAQRPGLTASVTYPSEDGVDRVVAFDVLLDDLTRYGREIEVSERGSLWLVTKDRRLLSWPEDPEIWQDRDPASALLETPRELGLPLIDAAVEALAEAGPENAGQPLRFTSGGESWWTLGRPFELSDEPRLSPSGEQGGGTLLIAVALPHADLLGERARQRWWILAITLAVLLGAVARAVVLARRFSEPIESLVKESHRIRQGDLEPGKPIVTPLAEVHDLADAHNEMRRGLRTLMKLESDLQLARQIQQKTFPRELPRLQGFDLVVWSEPADETGGDSYDVIGLDGDGTMTEGEADAERAVLLLADATGHGVGPALSVTQLRAMLRMAVRLGCDLSGLATHVNEQLYADLPANRFITAWFAEVRVADSTIATFSAGQAPLLVYRAADDQVEVLNADAPPLGLFPALPILAPPPVEMRPGDIYAVLSDGFFEAADPAGVELGKERVSEVIRRYRRETAVDILAAIRATLRELTGDAPADDDRTAVIVKRQS